MKKLSKAQQKVIDLMREGWQLGYSRGRRPDAWVQQNGIGRGGNSYHFSISTFFALDKLGYLKKVEEGYPTDKYELDESKYLICQDCGKKDVTVQKTTCPYAHDIKDEIIDIVACDECVGNRADEI